MKKLSILDMPEDLLDEDQPNGPLQSQKVRSEHTISKKTQLREPTLDRLVTRVTNTLGMNSQELNYWAKEAAVPEEVLKLILGTALRFKLNPLVGQIDWEQNLDDSYEVFIPIDGWIAMIHREPSFQGLTFSQATETEQGIPLWMDCSIYCSDLIQPITVREYFAELKTEHPIWQQMPRRMLRHKTLQQCARLAFGISIPKLKISIAPSIEGKPEMIRVNQFKPDRKELLKQKLTLNKI